MDRCKACKSYNVIYNVITPLTSTNVLVNIGLCEICALELMKNMTMVNINFDTVKPTWKISKQFGFGTKEEITQVPQNKRPYTIGHIFIKVYNYG